MPRRLAAEAAIAAGALQGHGDHGGVVDVGIVRVVEFEEPAAGLGAGAVLRPVGERSGIPFPAANCVARLAAS